MRFMHLDFPSGIMISIIYIMRIAFEYVYSYVAILISVVTKDCIYKGGWCRIRLV